MPVSLFCLILSAKIRNATKMNNKNKDLFFLRSLNRIFEDIKHPMHNLLHDNYNLMVNFQFMLAKID